jgi:Zn-dependent peptidase ImmA (M78 family)
MAIPTEIESRAEELLRAAGLEDEVPVPLEMVAGHLGFKCVGFTSDDATKDVSGAIDYANKTIYVNQSESLNRQRFTIAHEIGHAVLHVAEGVGMVDLRQSMDSPQTQKEREANQFAAAILMPREPFLREWSKTSSTVEGVAAAFGASKQAVEFRSKNLEVC